MLSLLVLVAANSVAGQAVGTPGLPPVLPPPPQFDSTTWYALLDDKPAYIMLWKNTVTHQYGGELYRIDKPIPQGVPWNIYTDFIENFQVWTLPGGSGYYVIFQKYATSYNPNTRTYVGLVDSSQSRINGQYTENGNVYNFDATLTLGEFVQGEYIMGITGQTCTQTCNTYGRVCNPQIITNNTPDLFRELAFANPGLFFCVNDTRNWWANDQPSYVSVTTDANYNRCLGWKNVPASVPCSGSYPTVRRICRCTAPSSIPTFPAGTYSMLSNGYAGDLNYSTGYLQDSTGQLPTATLDVLQTISNQQAGESLFYEGSRYVFFSRNITWWGVQNYTAIISKYTDHLDGKFTDHGADWPFNAVLSYPRGENELYMPQNLHGLYPLLANGWGGYLSISTSGITGAFTNAAITTTSQPQLNSGWETMTQITYTYQHGAWYIKFYRPNAAQTYYAVMNQLGSSLHGHFYDQNTERNWPFDAAKWY